MVSVKKFMFKMCLKNFVLKRTIFLTRNFLNTFLIWIFLTENNFLKNEEKLGVKKIHVKKNCVKKIKTFCVKKIRVINQKFCVNKIHVKKFVLKKSKHFVLKKFALKKSGKKIWNMTKYEIL